jgi:hypothetical protein
MYLPSGSDDPDRSGDDDIIPPLPNAMESSSSCIFQVPKTQRPDLSNKLQFIATALFYDEKPPPSRLAK